MLAGDGGPAAASALGWAEKRVEILLLRTRAASDAPSHGPRTELEDLIFPKDAKKIWQNKELF